MLQRNRRLTGPLLPPPRRHLLAINFYRFRRQQYVLAVSTGPRVIATILEHIDTRGARAPPIASA